MGNALALANPTIGHGQSLLTGTPAKPHPVPDGPVSTPTTQSSSKGKGPGHSLSSKNNQAEARQLRHVEKLVRKAAKHFPPASPVVLKIGFATSGPNRGSTVIQLVDRVTHHVYFRMPPDVATPLLARLQKHGMSPGLFVHSVA